MAASSVQPARWVHRPTGQPASQVAMGPYLIETILAASEQVATSVYRVRVPPGQVTAISQHRVAEEVYMVLAGRGVAILDGVAQPLAPGDVLRLLPGVTHGFVTGAEALDLLDIHAPPVRPDHDTYFVGPAPPGFGPAAPA